MAGRARGKVRPPRRGLTTDPVDFESIWASLSSSLREIHTKNSSQLSFEQLYRNAYRLVLKKQGEMLYNRVSELERDWLQEQVLPCITAVISPSLFLNESDRGGSEDFNERRVAGERLLKALKQAWEDYIVSMNMTTDVLMYMEDRAYCTDNNKPPLYTAAMGFFRDYVLRAPLPSYGDINIGKILSVVILHQIQLERQGELIDRTLIRACVHMLEGLYETDDEDESKKLYLTSFEPAFLRASAVFYSQEGKRLLNSVDAGSFCRHTKRRIDEESDRCHSALSPLTLSKIKQVIDKELIKDYMRDVIGLPGSGVKFMIDNDRFDELENIYDLISRVDPKKEDLKTAMQERISELGNDVNSSALSNVQGTHIALVADKKPEVTGEKRLALDRPANQQSSAAIQWVEDVLQLKDKFDAFLARALKNDQTLQTAITRSFSDFINAFHRSSEYLSLFFDENMKKGIKGKTENEVDEIIDKGIMLLRFINDKDMFERYYKRHLSRRLLMKRSASMDAERQMISKMKMEVGNTFTQRIEAMFKDMAISEDLTMQYRQHVAGLGAADQTRAELEVSVLTSTMWPLEAMSSASIEGEDRSTCLYPSVIDRVRLGFEKFYLDKHSGRRLSWQPGMGTADIRAMFPKCKGEKKVRELNVSTYAMIILLLFNDLSADQCLTCEEIQGRTGIPMQDLTRNLQSLAVAPKTRVLIKDPMSKDVKLDDRFYFNESFSSPFQKIKIGVVSNANRVEDSEERRQTEKKNNDARAAIVEAAIVRIMKQRKELPHAQLVTEVISQLTARFKPDVPTVKKRIESLIEREYLERIDGAEKASYRYLA